MSIICDHTLICCYLCNVSFSMPNVMYKQRKADGRAFWCPCGHDQHFTETDVTRLRRQVDRLEQQNRSLSETAEHYRKAERAACLRTAAARGQVTKIKKRIGKGVCPCCNRYFKELHRHMQDKHPEAMIEVEQARKGVA